MKKAIVVSTVVGAMAANHAYAFGINDLIGIGFRVGAELAGAAVSKAVDSVKESMRDPEAEARAKAEEERKLAEAFQKQVEQIEAERNLRPIDRERLILKLRRQQQWAQQVQAMAEAAEARQKAERDKIFTTSGFLGVVADAAMSSPSAVVAQAKLMTENPAWRAQQRVNNEIIFAQANAQVAAGIPQAKAKVALAQADVLQQTGIPQATMEAAVEAAKAMAQAGTNTHEVAAVVASASDAAEVARSHADSATAASEQPTASTRADVGKSPEADAFTPDLGRRIYIEFVGSPDETIKLRQRLAANGHRVVDTKDDADVAYIVEGEFSIPETKNHEGMTLAFGGLLQSPDKPIDPPAKKITGTISQGIGRFLLSAAAAQGQPVPAGAVPKSGVYQQEALLVIARQPKDGKETRHSVVKSANSESIIAAKLAQESVSELYAALGIDQ